MHVLIAKNSPQALLKDIHPFGAGIIKDTSVVMAYATVNTSWQAVNIIQELSKQVSLFLLKAIVEQQDILKESQTFSTGLKFGKRDSETMR